MHHYNGFAPLRYWFDTFYWLEFFVVVVFLPIALGSPGFCRSQSRARTRNTHTWLRNRILNHIRNLIQLSSRITNYAGHAALRTTLKVHDSVNFKMLLCQFLCVCCICTPISLLSLRTQVPTIKRNNKFLTIIKCKRFHVNTAIAQEFDASVFQLNEQVWANNKFCRFFSLPFYFNYSARYSQTISSSMLP